ncbi:MAG TPA: DUF4097 family beta strand repeat-containing protein [Thermomonas sp.]|jgi:DUF4097 and DUF4098 domain-containing protein YvlB|nr:DUF4097 family beta strand repeat-containing protein [Thermomonas sp.]
MHLDSKLFSALLLAAAVLPATAATPINQTRPLDPRGRVEVDNVKGRVEVVAWNRPEVQLSGSLGNGVEKLSVEGDSKVLRIKVQYPARGRNAEPSRLVLQVPLLADLEVDTVSADISVSGVASRELELQSVSGGITANGAPGRGKISTVSGDIQLAMNTPRLRVETVSGKLVTQGRLNGEIALESVSGDVRLNTLGERVRKLSANTVSGDMVLALALAEDGEIRMESVSGDLHLQLPADLSAQVSGESFSGDLSAPGAKIRKEEFGPGSSFRVRYGAGKGDIRMQTFSGDARLTLP